jgi:hypothetical protein
MTTATLNLEKRAEIWVRTRIGDAHMHPRERAMRLLEEAIELAQAEGISFEQVRAQAGYVFNRPVGNPEQEAGGVAVCLLAWCAARGFRLQDTALIELARIEAKPLKEIRGSVARKTDLDLVLCVPDENGA